MTDTQAEKQQAVREAWLLYFNKILCQQGLICEDDYRHIGLLIKKNSSRKQDAKQER